MIQKDLFGNTVEETSITSTYPWSHSRIGFLDACTLKYFYQYYGSKKRYAKNVADKQKISFLSHLGNKHLIAGTITHAAIENYFKRYKEGVNYDLNMILKYAFSELQKAYRQTVQARESNNIIFGPEDKIFKELFYNTVDIEKFKVEMQEKILLNLTNFYQAPEFQTFRNGGKQKGSSLEQWVIFKLMGYAAVKGKMDLGFETADGNYVVADWKTGNIENEETSLQLLLYAIWAIEIQKIEKEKVRLFKVYLQEKKVEELEFSDTHILRAKMRVIQDTQAIEKLHQYGVDGVQNAFSKIDYPNKICPLCPYEDLCHKTLIHGNKH